MKTLGNLCLLLVLSGVSTPHFGQTIQDRWGDFEARYGRSFVQWDAQFGTPHRVFGFDIQLTRANPSEAEIALAAQTFLEDNQAIFGSLNLDLESIHHVRGVWYVNLFQLHGNARVIDTEVVLRIGDSGKLMAFGIDVMPVADVQGPEGSFVVWDTDLEVFHHADYVNEFSNGALSHSLRATSDATVLRTYRKRCDAVYAGNSNGEILPVLATDLPMIEAMPNLFVSVNGMQAATDSEGNFAIELEATEATISAHLKGKYVDVIHFQQADATIEMQVEEADAIDLAWDDSNSTLEERNVYYQTDRAHAYVKNVDPDFTTLDYPLQCYVENNTAACNAYWNGVSINYNPQGTGCSINSAHSASTIYHEYGHAINDHVYQQAGAAFGLTNITLHEALADVTSCLMLNESQFALGWFGPGTSTRNLDNNNIFPQSVVGQQHTDGLILGGSFWDLGEMLSPPLAYELAHFAKYGTPDDADLGTAFSEYFLETLIADDDNGDLSDGTPHFDEINAAFCGHGIGLNLYLSDQVTHTPIDNQIILEEPLEVQLEVNIPTSILPYLGNVKLHYTTDNFNSQIEVPMIEEEGVFAGLIEPQSEGTVVKYYFEIAESACGTTNYSPSQEFEIYNHSFWVGDYATYFLHNFEVDQGWTAGGAGDNAIAGLWERDTPQQAVDGFGTVTQPNNDHTPVGTKCWVTGASVGGVWYAQDVDGGQTTVTSSVFSAIEGEETIIRFYRWFLHGTGSVPAVNGTWRMLITNDGTSWTTVELTGTTLANWEKGLYKISNIIEPTDQMQIQIVVSDPNPGSIVEGLFDDFEVLHLATPISVEEEIRRREYSVFPNPATEWVTLFGAFTGDNLLISVYDIHGRILRDLKPEQTSDYQFSGVRVDVSGFAPGIYSFVIRDGEYQHRQMFVVHR